jgi:ATP-dependent DNA helicase PIF1
MSSCVYVHSTGRYKLRERRCNTIGRLVHLNTRNMHHYHLYLLLLHQKGYRSFQELRTVDGVAYATYTEACRALGLLRDDREHVEAINDAARTAFGRQIRTLFTHMVSCA